jgi:hypothetical protein
MARSPLKPAPYCTWPREPKKFLDWLIGYHFPWNILFMSLALVSWFYLTPSIETLKTLAPGWIVYLLVRNSLLVLAVHGVLEFRLYILRVQGNCFKFNGKWPSEYPSDVFMFRNQSIDNIIRTFATGVPIWTT